MKKVISDVNTIKLEQAKAGIQEILDDDINFSDHSVGISGWGSEVKEEYITELKQCNLEISDWSKDHVIFKVGGHDIRIELVAHTVGPEEIEAQWEIVTKEKVNGIESINFVNFKINTITLLSYEFETKEDIYVEEAEDTFILFRLNYDKQNGEIDIYVANSEDYDVSECVTYLFDGQALLSYFQGLENAGLVTNDNTEEYLEYYGEELEDGELFGEGFIDQINFKIDTEEMSAYEFRASKDVYIKEGDYEADTFRIEFFKETNQIFILVAFDEDYDVGDEITHLCDTAAMLEYCINQDKSETLEDHTEQYIEHCKQQEMES